MFGTKHNECIGFESRWRVKKIYKEAPTQTTEYSSSEKGTNTQLKSSTEVQTIDEKLSTVTEEHDMRRLADWLNKIYPKVKEQIDDCNNSRAFDGYRLLGDSSDTKCKLLQTISLLETFSNIEAIEKMSKISSMSWNNTGKSIGVTSICEHKSWCHHTGCVAIYTFDRNGKLLDLPKKKLSADSCITNVKFHPGNPAIIAAGSVTGNLMVWNIQNDDLDDLIAVRNVHDEFVTQISWIQDLDKNVLLATSSTDGFLKLWHFSLSKHLSLNMCYKVKGPILSLQEKKMIDGKIYAIVCFDFSKHIPGIFVICLEDGSVIQCSMSGAKELKESTKEIPLFDPAIKYHEPHDGEVVSVSFSPNRREMFLTCGTDGEVRIYLIDQDDPAQVIFMKNAITDIAFVPYEEKLMICCDSQGYLKVFNIQSGEMVANINEENTKKNILSCLSLNMMKTNLVAVANEAGNLQLWSVPWASITMT